MAIDIFQVLGITKLFWIAILSTIFAFIWFFLPFKYIVGKKINAIIIIIPIVSWGLWVLMGWLASFFVNSPILFIIFIMSIVLGLVWFYTRNNNKK